MKRESKFLLCVFLKVLFHAFPLQSHIKPLGGGRKKKKPTLFKRNVIILFQAHSCTTGKKLHYLFWRGLGLRARQRDHSLCLRCLGVATRSQRGPARFSDKTRSFKMFAMGFPDLLKEKFIVTWFPKIIPIFASERLCLQHTAWHAWWWIS